MELIDEFSIDHRAEDVNHFLASKDTARSSEPLDLAIKCHRETDGFDEPLWVQSEGLYENKGLQSPFPPPIGGRSPNLMGLSK